MHTPVGPRLLPGDDPLFHTAPVLSSVGGMLDKVTPDLSLPDLDDSGNPLMRRLVNFIFTSRHGRQH